MINANELRVGNYVVFSEDRTIFKVIEISEKGLGIENKQEITWIEMETFEPIPLTEEILLKCGFKCSRGESFQLMLNDWTNLYYNCGYFEISVNKHAFSLNHIQYLHQLQNIYHSLTNKELEINLQ